MITELTPEQEAQLEIYAKKWYKILISTKPTNRFQSHKAIIQMYLNVSAKYEPPAKVIWYESPAQIYVEWEKFCAEYNELVGSLLLTNTVALHTIMHLFKENTLPSTISKIMRTLGTIFSFNALVHSQLEEELQIHFTRPYMTPFEFSCLVMHDFTREVFKSILPYNQQIQSLLDVTKSMGWYVAFDKVCMMSERHNILNLDNQDRPHCDNGLAIGYPDGWGVYAWHGVRVPEYVIMRPQDITPDNIMSEANAEVARVMLERYGQDNFIRDGGFTIQQSDDYGDLYRVEFENGSVPIVAVKVKIADTNQEQFLYVPYYVRTAREGVAWSFGYDNPDDYSPDKET